MRTNHMLSHVRIRSGWVVALGLVVICVLVTYPLFEEHATKRVILRMSSFFQEGLAPDPGIFTNDAVFRYENLQTPYDVALSVFTRQAAQQKATWHTYTYEVKNISVGTATLITLAWFRIGRSSYETSCVVVLRKACPFIWKVASISSDSPAFGELFFDAVPDM